MQTGLNLRAVPEVIADAVVVMAFEEEAPKLGLPVDEWITELYESGEFTGEKKKTALLHRPEGMKARRLLLAGCGKRGKFQVAELRNLAGAAVRSLKSKAVKKVALVLASGWQSGESVAAGIEGGILGNYEPERHKSEKRKETLESFAVVVADGDGRLSSDAERGRIVGESQNFTRDLISEPANTLTPVAMAERARSMAADVGLECEVLDRERMRQLGMGLLLGVAQGSAEPPALIVLRYRPETAAGDVHLGLVGKGVTFDTGGISIKPSLNMDEMKSDMSGGAAVLGAMRAIAQIKPAIPVTALVPAVENMPGSKAQRPGDIVTGLSGKTVEVLNTDAEGRLILADAL
ncbi:MAG: aminopeptidase, partial [bacterium]|nr:aminopeptidase [bacterium]